jgi:4'-phosphopantetheinyl transferase
MTAPDATTFVPCAAVPALADDEIHVWSLATAPGPPRAIGAAAREVLASLLCAYAGVGVAPVIERGEHGKPYAPALPELDFNLSHAGPHVLLAFARRQPLGIDVERGERRLAVDELAGRFFTANEADALAHLPAAARTAAFLALWTHKEAVLKALGAGLSFGLDRLEFAVDAHGRIAGLRAIAPEAGACADWRLLALAPTPGLLGALAWRGPPRTVRLLAHAC